MAEVFPMASRTLPPRMLVAFQITKQHRRFVEFADAVRRHVGNPRYQNLPNDALRVRSAA